MLYCRHHSPGLAGYAIIYAVRGVRHLLARYRGQSDRRTTLAEDCTESGRISTVDLGSNNGTLRDDQVAMEQAHREERAEAERRHQELMATLTAVLERSGHSAPADQSALIGQLQRRIAKLEAEVARLRNGDGANPTHGSAGE